MVNHGASGACHACKQRRKKCDQTRPSCLRCGRARRNCPGYEPGEARKFVNYIGRADYDLLHRRPTGLLHQTASFPNHYMLDWPFIEQEARLEFINDYCIVSSDRGLSRGYLHGLQAMIAKAGPKSELVHACTIVGLASLGKKLSHAAYIERAQSLYSLLLQSFRLSISNEAIFITIESLITAALLGLYEIIISTDAYPNAHVAHARGVSAILISRFSPFNLICGGQLFEVESPVSLEDFEVENSPSSRQQYSPVMGDDVPQRLSVMCTPLFQQSSSSIDVLYAQTEPLFRKAELLLDGGESTLIQIHQLKLEAQQMKREYDVLIESTPQEWMPRSVGYIASKHDGSIPDVGYWPGTVSSYYDLYVASMWNNYRKACLLILDVIIRCHRWIGRYPEDLDMDAPIQREVARLTEGIVSSIPYLLSADPSAFLSNAATRSPPLVPGRPIGGLLSMHAFYVLSTLPINEAKLRVYIRNCLAWIGTYMGIGQATIMSKCVTMEQFECPREARVLIWTGMLI